MTRNASGAEVMRSAMLTCPHGFSTRLGGVSGGIFESLNLGRLDLGDAPENVAQNWEIFGRACGIDTAGFVHGKQVHGNVVRVVGPDDMHGILESGGTDGSDGYVTNVPGVPLAVFTADCVPLLMQEPEAGVVAAVHCGWRSTALDIEAAALEKMRALGAQPRRVRAAIGPCIRRCCFQTGAEVTEAMDRLLGGGSDLYAPDPSAAGKYLLDLPGVVRRRLTQLGVPADQIDDLNECTKCHPRRFWSHRRLGMSRGSQANIIML